MKNIIYVLLGMAGFFVTGWISIKYVFERSPTDLEQGLLWIYTLIVGVCLILVSKYDNKRKSPVRIETGPIKFGDDWCGVYIRGDDAAGYNAFIKIALANPNLDPITRESLMALSNLLESSREGG